MLSGSDSKNIFNAHDPNGYNTFPIGSRKVYYWAGWTKGFQSKTKIEYDTERENVEELATVGLGDDQHDITENDLRREQGLWERAAYKSGISENRQHAADVK